MSFFAFVLVVLQRILHFPNNREVLCEDWFTLLSYIMAAVAFVLRFKDHVYG